MRTVGKAELGVFCEVLGGVGVEVVEAHRLFCEVDFKPLKIPISRVLGTAPLCCNCTYKTCIEIVKQVIEKLGIRTTRMIVSKLPNILFYFYSFPLHAAWYQRGQGLLSG